MDKLDMKTENITQGNIEKIRQLFPNAVTEAKKNGKTELAIDFDMLKQELSESLIDEGKERYQMTWPGKRQAVVTAAAGPHEEKTGGSGGQQQHAPRTAQKSGPLPGPPDQPADPPDQ